MAPAKRPWSPPQMIFSALAGIAVWTAVGFSWFGHGFNWETQGSAMRMSVDAVKEDQAQICVAQARGASDTGTAMARFNGLSKWKQGDFVAKQGWAAMPGQSTINSSMSAKCAELIIGEKS